MVESRNPWLGHRTWAGRCPCAVERFGRKVEDW